MLRERLTELLQKNDWMRQQISVQHVMKFEFQWQKRGDGQSPLLFELHFLVFGLC